MFCFASSCFAFFDGFLSMPASSGNWFLRRSSQGGLRARSGAASTALPGGTPGRRPLLSASSAAIPPSTCPQRVPAPAPGQEAPRWSQQPLCIPYSALWPPGVPRAGGFQRHVRGNLYGLSNIFAPGSLQRNTDFFEGEKCWSPGVWHTTAPCIGVHKACPGPRGVVRGGPVLGARFPCPRTVT